MTVWGIDPSTRVIALAVVADGEVVHVDQLALEQASSPQLRLFRALEDLAPWLQQLAVEHGKPRLVLLEQPFGVGRQVHPQSFYMVGAVLTALVMALGRGVDVRTLGPGKWKLAAYGYGALKKDELMTLARGRWPVRSQDEADAVGIALAARTLT